MTIEQCGALLRFALYIDLMLLFGLPTFALHRGRSGRSVVPALLSVGGILLSGAALVVMVASMAGTPITAVEPALVAGFVAGSSIGRVLLVRLTALIIAVPAALGARTQPLLVLAGGVALGSLAWTGHGAMDDGAIGWLHLVADIFHLLAAGIWIGALVALGTLVSRTFATHAERGEAVEALAGFSSLGTGAVAVLTTTGAINLWAMLPTTSLWPLNLYCGLLALKLIAFMGMLALAGLNRFVLTPRLARDAAGIRLSLATEAGLGAIILLLVANLGMLAP